MCKLIGVHPSCFYAWPKEPLSTPAKEDQYWIGFIRQFWIESVTVYGYRKIYDDMQSAGEAVVLDLYSRQIVGWSMQSRMTSAIVMDALAMA
ncbi:MAG: putative transposase [Patiriisocius sp.]|jgi:putative transposase